jgi:DNA polymerase
VSKTNKQRQLNKLFTEIVGNDVCTELAEQATQLVPGVGNPDSDIVFIGEAPGKNEDKQGEPFIGAAGKLLNELLESIGLTREEIYITNIVKYRPPNNRDPSTAEKQQFVGYLTRELAIIEPNVIVTLGRHATESFLPDLRISQVHGQQQRNGNSVIMPLYHPAAALYNGGLRQTLFDDFALLQQFI